MVFQGTVVVHPPRREALRPSAFSAPGSPSREARSRLAGLQRFSPAARARSVGPVRRAGGPHRVRPARYKSKTEHWIYSMEV